MQVVSIRASPLLPWHQGLSPPQAWAQHCVGGGRGREWWGSLVEGGRAPLPETPTPGCLPLCRPPSIQAEFTHCDSGGWWVDSLVSQAEALSLRCSYSSLTPDFPPHGAAMASWSRSTKLHSSTGYEAGAGVLPTAVHSHWPRKLDTWV